MPKKATQDAQQLLMSRERSSMAAQWEEHLFSVRVKGNSFRICTGRYEILGSIYDLVPEEQLYDDDGNLVIPAFVDGKKVIGLEDGEYLQVNHLETEESSDAFDVSTLEIAKNFCAAQGWEVADGFQSAWTQLQQRVKAA